ncbi:methionine aminopeptidase, type I [Catenulispora acidiphila DSM 44928]|uniref:Methionine aminopeptidase n=1 Tax=Catenulispora acidiphila (strain DSM 44928 / JCM 14897 / NBRC 102108 / NRRL B-24433 / ID139908) TaxID=479433 RepID=C7Q425_CATAD|nr:type I methionyl aminopeptidase [Catenulispora acidiphila]ACU69885.1 methionine aminopeptidase, type I [Catenulispora acidiphila DSM 44928]
MHAHGDDDGIIELKTPEQFEAMKQAGKVVSRTLALLRSAVRPGITTGELDWIAEESIRSQGAAPSFLGYGDFPGSICASVNEEIVHGIPGSRVLREGDLISLDCGAIIPDEAARAADGRWNTKGWHADAAITVAVGEVAPELAELSRVTEQAMWAGINAVKEGVALNDVSTAIDSSTRSQPRRYGIVRDYGGHGIGSSMHMAPMVFNYPVRGENTVLATGMAIAIEPMLTLGKNKTRVLADDWTVVAKDGSYAAHWEHTVALTPDGVVVTTAPEE